MKNKMLQSLIVWTLHGMTASAMKGPFRPGKPALQAYAAFTKEQLEQMPASELPAVQERMYRISHRMGSLLRTILLIRTQKRARKVVFWLYRNIGITLDGACPGAITVRRCYFSACYTPEQCRIMSAMDRGIFVGLFGGGELTFTSRITEGCPCCHAVFSLEEMRSGK